MRSSGAYVLIVHLPAPVTLRVGSLGPQSFKEGHYLYCGSAQAGLMSRLARHMRVDKRRHWHIDHLTCHGGTVGALAFEGRKETECLLASTLAAVPGVLPAVQGFGSSDCGCLTHLFLVKDGVPLSIVLDFLRSSFSERPRGGQSI